MIFVMLYYSAHAAWESGLRQRYDGYGEDWIFMPDGNGQPQVAVLKVQESGTRGVLDGSDITYVIYTRYLIMYNKRYIRIMFELLYVLFHFLSSLQDLVQKQERVLL